jgi:site-specific DNA recombinase
MRCAIYTRYSSDRQREASSEDQARNCVRRVESEGWQLAGQFIDKAVSGSRSDRPAYQQMLKAAQAREFDVLVIDDLSRFGRDQVEAERAIRRLEFSGLRIIAIGDGYDSQSKARKIQRGVKGLMNELYLDDLKEKTHRGLTGQALKKFWAGGKPYGYRLIRIKDPSKLDSYGEALAIGTSLEIAEEQAAIVRWIFARYGDGWSPRAIAAELNQRGIASPGASWRNRTVRRLSGWLQSAVKSILESELYLGAYIWNKTCWQKDPDTGKRRVVRRPQSEWVRARMPELQIVPDELAQRVQARHAHAAAAGANVREGIKRSGHRAGRSPGYLFSSLLKCGVCGGSMVIIGGQARWKTYGCATHKDGGEAACSNGLTAKLPIVEARLLRRIREDLFTPELAAEVDHRYARTVVRQPKLPANDKRIAELNAEVGNLTEAVASGALRASKALGARLAAAECELERLSSARAASRKVVRMPLPSGERYRRLVANLEAELNRDVHKARTALRRIVGNEIPVLPHESGKHLVAKIGLDTEALMASGASEIFVVAGAGFEPATFGL